MKICSTCFLLAGERERDLTTSYHPHFNNISALQNENHFTDGNGEYCGEGINAHELQLEIQKVDCRWNLYCSAVNSRCNPRCYS